MLLFSGIAIYSAFAAWSPEYIPVFEDMPYTEAPADSVSPRFPVSKTSVETYEDLLQNRPADLKNPENLKSEIEYDPATNSYVFRTKVGDMDVSTPFMLNSNEYNEYTLKKSLEAYYREKNAESFAKGKDEFDFLDMKFNIGPLDKVFGPGGVQIKTQGSAELSFGLKMNKIDNPTLTPRARKKTYFDFDEKIQANITATVGDKLNFSMNYNTDATFDFDSQKLKLQYQGKEDEIIKNIEAGNVSMTTGSTLIRGSAALFGMKTTLQFGKLQVTALVSQQESDSKTINTKGGAQTTEFEFSADQYDENRHFFLAQFFRDHYDRFVSKLPHISSGITIKNIEVWVTNTRNAYDNARNIVGFMDLGENELNYLGNKNEWHINTAYSGPANQANSLYQTLTQTAELEEARNINKVTQVLERYFAGKNVEGGVDYVKLESARKLEPSEYTLNAQLGYISLKSMLNPDEVLCVAYDYTMNGQNYKVGEFTTDVQDANKSLYLKMLKGTTVTTNLPIWKLMMKNVYSLGAYQVQKEKFRLNILYLSDTTGTQLNYLPTGKTKNEILLRVLNLDRLDANLEPNPDGVFDYVEGYTILSQNGKVIFPAVEPFGSYLREKTGDTTYVFQELYDSTLTVARQMADKNKFLMKGEYRSSSGSEIYLNAMNVPRGSVVVTAGGKTLIEGSDYTVDYNMGVVTIMNDSYIDSGTPISVSLENQSMFSMQRKTMLGLDLNYAFNKNFNLGATVMHLSEKPLTEKVTMGDEVLNNTLWGVNLAYNTEFQWLTNWVNKVPFINATTPSRLALTAEFAQLVPKKTSSDKASGKAYLDDFESSQLSIDLRDPYSWHLASTPVGATDKEGRELFPEATLTDNVEYGMNRALLSWYYIDRLFTQKRSSLTPAHIKNDLEQLSNHYVREIETSELYPNKELGYGDANVLQVLNLSYYPEERGPYNLDATHISEEGKLLNPEQRWGGIMKAMEHNTDFEAANIEYVQFWLLDPFIYDSLSNEGGELYLNFGEISEDVLKDGRKSFENGLPVDGDTTYLTSTVWGRVSNRQSVSTGFDNSVSGGIRMQDVGLDGLPNAEEFTFSSYANYLEKLLTKLSPSAKAAMENDPFSPLNDPAGDNYHSYRGNDYDEQELDILSRYKHYNGVEGNSSATDEQAARSTPDIEDINMDNTLNEYERYFQYRVSLRPQEMKVGSNHITDIRTAYVKLANGKTDEVRWYQFKVPLREYDKQVGSIQDFKTIRFVRMFLTGFKKEIHLRFGSLELVKGEWRTYTKSLNEGGTASVGAHLDVSVVNIEENAGQVPVNYVLPPGVTRIIDPSQSQITQLNEQAMSLKVTDLEYSNALGVYKNTKIDMRMYKRLQMFVHAEALIDDVNGLQNGDFALFIRMGADQQANYYEYEIPLEVTPPGLYNTYNYQDQLTVWPEQNMLDFPLSLWTDLKLKRNAEKRRENSNVTFQTPYYIYDPDHTRNKATVVGNPSLSDVRTVLIGIRNRGRSKKSGIVWVNELRLTDFDQKGGWAAKGNANLAVSDIATINIGGQIETVGFGGLDQGLNERRMDDYYQYNIATMVELGRLLPERLKLRAPLFWSVTDQRNNPKYNPLDQDILLKDALDAASTSEERDSILEFSQERLTVKSFSLSGLKFDIQSKTPMPYDPANFSISYSSNRQNRKDPTTTFENTSDYRGNFTYSYSPYVKPLTPFSFIKSKSKHLRLLKDFGFNYLPNNISFYTNISRYYYEQQLRDFSEGSDSHLPVTFSKNFLWDRQFALQWNFTKAITASLNTMTNARIDEPSGPVNKKLFPEEYEMWKDTVMHSILSLGTPWNYNQVFNVSFNVPLNKIPVLDWSSLSFKYNSSYAWDRGVYVDETTNLGNSINNQAQYSIDGRLNLETLYNKSKFLKKVNQKFSSNSRSRNMPPRNNKKKYEQKIRLKSDTTTAIKHNLDNKKVRVTAKDAKGAYYRIRYRVVDKNTILIENRDTAQIMLSVLPGKRPDETFWYRAAEYGSRFGMMIRNVSVRYRRSSSLFVPSFIPNVGDIFGQSRGDYLAPGLDFAFGMPDENYIQKIMARNWLLVDDSSLVSPAVSSRTEEFQFDANIEPVRGLKITLQGNWQKSDNNQIEFMYPGMPMFRGGNFSMTHISLRTAFHASKASDGYQSDAFNQFLNNREIIAERLDRQYSPYRQDAKLAEVSKNSADVMIPAFLAAYTGRDAGKIKLTAFPSLSSLLPNWRVTYDGLIRIPFFQQYLKNITLSHAYKCIYTVGSYSSFLQWASLGDGLGYVPVEQNDSLMPSSQFDIATVSITESFAPLFGVNITMKNNVTSRFEYKDARNLTLNMGSGQLIEGMTRDITVGVGYTIANFNAILKMGGAQKGFNNDLRLQADLSFRKTQTLIRRIEENFTQATNGTKTLTLKFTADYALSKLVTLRAFYDKRINTPLVSSTSYPTSDNSFGISVRLSLTR